MGSKREFRIAVVGGDRTGEGVMWPCLKVLHEVTNIVGGISLKYEMSQRRILFSIYYQIYLQPGKVLTIKDGFLISFFP